MTDPATTLLDFVERLENDSDYCKAYTDDPEGTMEAAGLTPDDREILLSRDLQRIGAAIGRNYPAGRWTNCSGGG